VVINHIITKNTIDERILAVLKNKDATQEELIAAVKAEV
jgi:SNF2 family DNA or RNA helicase